ncbi:MULTISPECIES: carbamoyltransferase HypF [unclassified Nitrospina]|uniref:carbamoyltransferase HypF n=1 Tax=unclassified Nitrospina TaxID=2638683 RepID=UPI003F9D3A18
METGDITTRIRITLRGKVQGVGFRPFIYNLATDLNLTGWVANTGQGVVIDAEGPLSNLDAFLYRIDEEKPPLAHIQGLEHTYLDPEGYEIFEIRESSDGTAKSFWVLPDIATCGDCLEEVFDPQNRRHRYPFTNCTRCGPRFSIMTALPYDRPNTSMRVFEMCEACLAEYEDPQNRRFHAQPNACPQCGPRLSYLDPAGTELAAGDDALMRAVEALRDGCIVAVKGLGGFHLMADASSEEAIGQLRKSKQREEKPLAVLFPDLESVQQVCDVSPMERRALLSPETPIVLLHRKNNSLPDNIAPDNPYLGVLLPMTALHHLIARELGRPVIATSGNLSEETLCTQNDEALQRLNKMADGFLVHDRDIVNHVDDSIVRVVLGREMVLRRGRGFAPSTFPITRHWGFGSVDLQVLAVGPHMKNTVALYKNGEIALSQHIGDLVSPHSVTTFKKTIDTLTRFYGIQPELVVHDFHPDYASTRYAEDRDLPRDAVQHHFAHVLACMVDNEVPPPALGVSWDGTGYGLDRTVWGGEFLLVSEEGFSREGHFRSFMLPGGEQAVREPRRAALGLLYEMLGVEVFERNDLMNSLRWSPPERDVLCGMLEKQMNAPRTSSAGRLFDAVSALLGLGLHNRYEGQGAMRLEFATGIFLSPAESKAGPVRSPAREPWISEEEIVGSPRNSGGPSSIGIPWSDERYTFKILEVGSGKSPAEAVHRYTYVVDWQPMIEEILSDLARHRAVNEIATTFHHTLADIVVGMAQLVGEPRVVLSGGCFQNRVLTEMTVTALREAGFQPSWHQRIPPNDGGVAVGQILAALQKEAPKTIM